MEHCVKRGNDTLCQKLSLAITYLLTACSRVLLEKLTGLQLVKKFPPISRNPKVHYRTHKRPPPISILGQPNPVHITTSHLLEIHLNIIHPSTPRWADDYHIINCFINQPSYRKLCQRVANSWYQRSTSIGLQTLLQYGMYETKLRWCKVVLTHTKMHDTSKSPLYIFTNIWLVNLLST